MHKRKAPFRCEACATRLDGLAIAVDCDEASLRSEGCEDPLAVPAASVRRIDVVAGRAHGKSCKHLIDKHRFVLIQIPPPGAPELSSL
jgi:hypothetical protein